MTPQSIPRPLLLTKAELMAWMRVSKMWVQDRLAEEDFVEKCVVDISPGATPRRTLRFNADAIAARLNIPESRHLCCAACGSTELVANTASAAA